MIQLRDAKTSEIIAEGTPGSIAFLAEKLGRENVLFDGVGERFDPDAVIAAHKAEIKGLKEVSSDDPSASLAQERLRELTAEQRFTKEQVAAATKVAESAQDGDRETLPHIVLE